MTKPLLALTGGTGFIGRYLLRALSERGYRLRVLLRRPSDLPLDCASAVVGDLARPQNMAAALADAEAIIHTAGVAQTMTGSPADDHRSLDAEATIALARAAQRAGLKRFVFLSSIAAQSGPTADAPLTESMEARPVDDYGRQKLAAEQGLAQTDYDWVALRMALVYGPGVTGNMAQLMRLARSPFPLPLGGLTARRSLLGLDNLAAAIECALAAAPPLRRVLIAADPEPLTVPEMIAAMRRGLDRRPSLVPVPAALLAAGLRATGRAELFSRLAGPLVADPSALLALGWKPPVRTADGLEQLMKGEAAKAAG